MTVERLPYNLCQYFWRHSAEQKPLALITVLNTEGSTYSKVGRQMLVDESGDFHGMLSGGCLEGDLALRSKSVIGNGIAEKITYDLRADDEVFGLGVGCEGALHVLIQSLNAETGYEPFQTLVNSLEDSPFADLPLTDGETDFGVTRIQAPLRLLILGAGQDAEPLIHFGVSLGWRVVVSDHRLAAVERLAASAAAVNCVPIEQVQSFFDLNRFDAVIAMSHNLTADRQYLTVLAETDVEFLGLLGPPHRRDRLLDEIGPVASKLGGRLRSPVGLQIGGRGPAAIALEIAAQLQEHFSPVG